MVPNWTGQLNKHILRGLENTDVDTFCHWMVNSDNSHTQIVSVCYQPKTLSVCYQPQACFFKGYSDNFHVTEI